MFKSTPLLMIETPEALHELVLSLRDEPVVGVDTEADSFHHYQEKLCLIQISDLKRDVIVDPLKVKDISPLGELLENPDQLKILHGADYDVVSLKRDYGFQTTNLFDTMIASQFLGLPRIGLADLIFQFFGHEIDKKYQRHDWAQRPLEAEHLEYARGDTHFLLALHEILSHKLNRAGRLEHVMEECRLIEEREWSGRGADPDLAFQRIKGQNMLDEAGLRVLRAVARYRDECARELDRPAFKVMPEDKLLELSARRPDTRDGVLDILRAGSPLARRHGDGLFEAVRRGLADTEPLPQIKRTSSRTGPTAAGGGDRLLLPLKNWRNEVVSRKGYAPTVVASNTLLKEIARLAPQTLDELAAVPGIRSWQVADFGEEITALVRGVVTDQPAPRAHKRRRRRRA